MGISDKTRKILWGRSGNHCAICHHELVMNATSLDDKSVVGEECHIIAREPNGPRGQSPLTPDERDSYDNLILLCRVHHKLIDDQPNAYDVQCLKKIKTQHEAWVRESLNSRNHIKSSGELSFAYRVSLNEEILDDNLSSELGKDYRKLRELLAENNWQAADKETMLLMREVFGQDVKNFSLLDLQTIDHLWLKYSKGKFGFSVQRRVLDKAFSDSKVTPETCLSEYEMLKSIDELSDRLVARWQRFGENLGWHVQGQWIMVIDYSREVVNKPEGYLPLLGEPPQFYVIQTNRSMIPWWWALLLRLQPWVS
jgi:hypothetical protein